MKKTTHFSLLALVLVAAILGGCGGSSSDTPAIVTTTTTTTATTAVLTLMTSGTLSTSGTGTRIGTVQVTVSLPAGVTIKASPFSAGSTTMVADAGVVTASGAASGADLAMAIYRSGASSTHMVDVYIVKNSGFSTGEFATVNCDIASGYTPVAADFTLSGFAANAMDTGSPLPALSSGITAAIQ